MNWKMEVKTFEDDFTGNAIVLATRGEAQAYARNLSSRWTLVKEWRVLETSEPVNYVADEFGDLERISDGVG